MRRVVFGALVWSVVGLSSWSAAAAKLVIMPPTTTSGLGEQVVVNAVAAAASRAGHDVVTNEQLQALLGLEASRQLSGCVATSCVAELGDALGADAVLTVSLAAAGQSVVVTLKRADVRGGAGSVVDRRVKRKGAIDAVLDAVPTLVTEALTSLPGTAPTAATTAATPTTTGAAAIALPVRAANTLAPARRDDVIATPTGLTFVDDGHGRFIAFHVDDPTGKPLYAGTSTSMYQLHAGGSSSSDGEGGFSQTFWDPRFAGGGAGRSFDVVAGKHTLTCGDKTIEFTKTKKAPSPKFFAPAWRRQALLVGRDDRLRYVVVEGARADEPTDLQVHVGKKGKLVALDVEIERDPSFGDGGIIAVGDGVTVKLGPAGGSIVEGTATTPLTGLDLWDNARLLYREVQPWGPLDLGTPCDGRL
jgi:hypothetical protein